MSQHQRRCRAGGTDAADNEPTARIVIRQCLLLPKHFIDDFYHRFAVIGLNAGYSPRWRAGIHHLYPEWPGERGGYPDE